jgi:hypothetical protein
MGTIILHVESPKYIMGNFGLTHLGVWSLTSKHLVYLTPYRFVQNNKAEPFLKVVGIIESPLFDSLT